MSDNDDSNEVSSPSQPIAETLETPTNEEYKEKAFDMYLMGKGYREIAKELDCGVSHVTIFNWVKKELKFSVKNRIGMADEHIETEAHRLDHIIKLTMRDIEKSIETNYDYETQKMRVAQIKKVDPAMAKIIMEAIKLKVNLFGMAKPQKIEVTNKMDLSELVKLAGKVTDDEIRAEFTPIDVPLVMIDENPSPKGVG